MDLLQKQEQLKNCIRTALLPIIDNDYVFIDLPYYENIGDVLIWNGTEVFLKEVMHKCLYRASFFTFDFRKLDNSIIIIMQGGGNWGDLWHEHNDFRKQIINKYPNNRIIILPQTVYYKNIINQKEDLSLFSKHSNLIVCARDKQSFDLLYDNLSCEVFLLPDMAFFLDFPKRMNRSGRTLFLKRNDKELRGGDYSVVPQNADIHDWPTYENKVMVDKWLNRFIFVIQRMFPSFKFSDFHRTNDFLFQKIIRHVYLKEGVKLLNQYDIIYSTRLHAAILGVLLGKQVFLFDNTYGKNKNFYHTWLRDLDSVNLISQ